MKSILIFDHLNDVLYAKYNKKFSKHLRKLSQEQGFISDERVCRYVRELRWYKRWHRFPDCNIFPTFRMMMNLAPIF
jgi:hypothetical protein